MYVLTSNQHKIKEYQRLGLETREGPDIPEVLGTIDEVIIYKILSIAPHVLVEDTALIIDGKDIVDTKYRIRNIPETNDASWITSLGFHDNTYLYIYRGIVKGKITPEVRNCTVSFEPCFIPEGANITLYELRLNGNKEKFSARRLAVEAYKNGNPVICKFINEIPTWTGKYQSQY